MEIFSLFPDAILTSVCKSSFDASLARALVPCKKISASVQNAQVICVARDAVKCKIRERTKHSSPEQGQTYRKLNEPFDKQSKLF